MSELKDYDIMDIEAMDAVRLEKSESGRIQVSRVYFKSEADLEIARQKRKRCLALADYAEAASCYHATLANGFWLLRNDLKKRDDERRIAKRWDKWQNRWLAIAEKFKPNSTAQ